MEQRKTSSESEYFILNNKNIHKKSPGSYYDRSKNISIMILEKKVNSDYDFYLRDITYLDLDKAYEKYIIESSTTYPSPFEHIQVAYLDILKNRIISQYKYKEIYEEKDYRDYKEDKEEMFHKYCLGNISDKERVYLDNTMYFDDHLIDWSLSSDFGLREKAIELINKSSIGSWLVRRSSVKESEHIKIRVITCKVEKIGNYLVAHINGFGYVITNTFQGSSMPSIGEDKTIMINASFFSLPDLLDYMKKDHGINLNSIIREKIKEE